MAFTAPLYAKRHYGHQQKDDSDGNLCDYGTQQGLTKQQYDRKTETFNMNVSYTYIRYARAHE